MPVPVQPPSGCQIVPPWLIRRLTTHPSAHVADCARRTLSADQGFRAAPRRLDQTALPVRPEAVGSSDAAPAGSAPRRQISDAAGGTDLPGRPVRAEGEPATGDPAADEAYAGLGETWQLFWSAFGRDSLDAAGAPLLGSVHYDQAYDNAFWDGTQMVFGDGDGEVFNRFTLSLDVIGHELAHGVTEQTARLVYQGQSGALNESVSDVFGSLVRQHSLGQSADEADWLIGADLLTDQVQGVALRSMRSPGTAYDDDVLGRDPQPATMADYVQTTDDNGGVHLNSGIPNRAFYLAATAIGGPAWERAGQVWYDVLTGTEITPSCDFATFAALTVDAASSRFGEGSEEARAVAEGWQQVGVVAAARPTSPGRTGPATGEPLPETGPRADPEGPDGGDAGVGAGRATVELIRHGGVGGTVQHTTFVPDELEPPDAEEWQGLLTRPTFWAGVPETSSGADDFTYRVLAIQLELDTTVSERALPASVRDLVRRTLGRGGG